MSDTDRFLDSMASIVRKALPWIGFCGTYEYLVFSADPPKYDLRAVDSKAGLPPLPDVSFKPGIPGLTSELQVGSLVYVGFINHVSTRPFIVGVAGPGDAGFTPTSIALVASGSMRIDGASITCGAPGPNLAPPVRYGDTVAITGSGAAAGVIGLTTPFGIPPTPTKVLA